ncbi:unnamed protein product [Effrenium voratum]|nr:unnamed protein product [Effrenium voratum]
MDRQSPPHQAEPESECRFAQVARAVAQIWFGYIYPLCFLAASFMRPNTIVSGIYVLMAFVALFLPAVFAKRCEWEAWRWKRLHLIVCLSCASMFTAAAVMLIICRNDGLKSEALAAGRQLFFGMDGCNIASSLFPETLAACSAMLGVSLSCCTKKLQERPLPEVHSNPLLSPTRLAAVAVVLFCSASLHFNVFAAVYHIATLCILFCWACVNPYCSRGSAQDCFMGRLAFLRVTLMVVCTAQVAVAAIFSFPFLPDMSESAARLLGLEVGLLMYWQLLASFFLMQLLLWPAFVGQRIEVRDVQAKPLSRPPRGISEEIRRMEQAPSPPSANAVEAQGRVPHARIPDSPMSIPAEGMGAQIDKEVQSARWQQWLANKVSFACGRSPLPLFSMLSLVVVWPSLATLPLLLGGLCLMHIPVDYLPSCFFHSLLVYEMLCSLIWYCFNIFCSATGAPLSNVPREFTWMERSGLQCYLRAGPYNPELRRYLFALGQGVALLAAAACARSRAWQGIEKRACEARKVSEDDEVDDRAPPHPENPTCRQGRFLQSTALRKVVALIRPLTVSFVVLVGLGQNPPNLLGLAYLLWLVGLAICGAFTSYVSSGWDILRASGFMWRSLLLLSNCEVLALFYWQVMRTDDNNFVGLQRSMQTLLEVSWSHFVIGVLAAVQTLALFQRVPTPAMFVNSNSALAWFLWIAGIFFEMGLMLNMVMIEPFTVDSFFILILMLGIVAVEQFDAPTTWRNWLLTATAVTCGILLPLRYMLLMPQVQEWLSGPSSPLPKEQYLPVWEAFALAETSMEVRVKLGYLATLLLVSVGLRRIYRFGEAASLIGARSQVFITKNKVMMTILLEAARWSTVVLICTAYFIMPRNSASSHLQLIVLILMLMSGRGWNYAGGFISLTSSVLLLAQYAYTFQLVEIPEDQAAYWGLHRQGYYAEVSLLLIGIVQRTVKRAALHCLSNVPSAAQLHQEARERRQQVRQETVAYSAHIGAAILLLAGLFCNSAWSLIYIGMVMLFACSKDSRRCCSAGASNWWLRLFILLLALSLTVYLGFEAWLPPGTLKKPSADLVSSLLCEKYADAPMIWNSARQCLPGGCASQRQLCGQAWASWIGLSENSEGSSRITFNFMTFFCVCLLRHMCLAELDCQCSAMQEKAAEGEEATATSSPEEVEMDMQEGDEGGWSARIPQLAATWPSILLNASLALAAIQQPDASLISLCYLMLLLWNLFTLQSVQLVEASHKTRKRANKWIQGCNLAFCFAVACFQCPAVPCAFALRSINCQECPETFFVAPALCRELSASSVTSWSGSWDPASVLLQCLGVQKLEEGLNFSWSNFWMLWVFMASLAQALAANRWRDLYEADLEETMRILALRERWYNEHLLHWRRQELRRIDTKHKVLLVKLHSLMAYIAGLRDIWENKRGELTAQERANRAREDRILQLCLSSGHPPHAVEPVLEAFTQEAAEAAGPFSDKLRHIPESFAASSSGDKDQIAEERASALEVARLDAFDTIDHCVLSHLQDLQLQRLRRITAQDVSDRRDVLLDRCTEAGEVLRALLPEEDQEVEYERSWARSSKASQLRRQHAVIGDIVEPGGKDAIRGVLLRWKAKLVLWAYLGIGKLVDDFLYTCDADATLQHHRRNDGFVKLLYKAFWSQTLLLLLIFSIVQFAVYTSVLAACTTCAIVASLMSFPHPHPRFWKWLTIFNLGIVVLKVLYQLPLWPISLDYVRLEADLEHGLSAGIPVPWESVLGLIKVAPTINAINQKDLVDEAVKQMEFRDLVHHSLLGFLWPDLLVCAFLVCHWQTLRHSGRLGNPAQICRRLALDDLRARQRVQTRNVEAIPSERQAAGPVGPKCKTLQPHPCMPPLASHNRMLRGNTMLPGTEKPRSQRYAEGLMGHLRNAMSAVGLRKPAMDLFAPRAGLMMCCFCIILIGWDRLMDSNESFADSISSNSFSREQVFAVTLCLVLMVEARAEYTWYTQYRWKGPEGVGQDANDEKGDKARGSPGRVAPESQGRSAMLKYITVNHVVFIAQRILLMAELIALHVFFVSRWAGNSTFKPRMTNSVQLIFYLLFMIYLALTSLQMRYDVHVTSGGLGLTHSMQFFPSLAFKGYLAVPFVEEMRVLTDWTVTRTSMDFFMWMKLEDAQQGLYRTKRDFHLRRWYPPAAPRPAWEKVLQGGLLLIGLGALIVAPIALFSTLNPNLQSNRLTSAGLTGNLVVQSTEEGIRQLQLYKGSQASIVAGPYKDESRMDVAEVSFVMASEEYFDSSAAMQAHIARALGEPDTTAWFELQYQLEFNGDTGDGRQTSTSYRVELSPNSTLDLGRLVNESLDLGNVDKVGVLIPSALKPTIRVNSNLEASMVGEASDLILAFQSSRDRLAHGRDRGSQIHSVSEADGVVTSAGNSLPSCAASQLVASEKSAPVPVGGASSSSWSVMGIYLGVVYTVGRLLRSAFQDSSKRVIYEEIPDTSLLEDLCNGIYIARIQRLLRTEYKLYYQLLSLLRSPELLLNVTGTFGDKKLDNEMDFMAEGEYEVGCGCDGGGKIQAADQWLSAANAGAHAEQESHETYIVPETSAAIEEDLRQMDEIEEDLRAAENPQMGEVELERFMGVADSQFAPTSRLEDISTSVSPSGELRRRSQATSHRASAASNLEI